MLDGDRYSNAHVWRFDGGAEIAASSSPDIVPEPMSDPSAVDPEEAFVAALSSCHMLCFLAVSRKAGFAVRQYLDHAEGMMGKNSDGKMVVLKVNLRPFIEWESAIPASSTISEMHEAAHEVCFIANSVKTAVSIES